MKKIIISATAICFLIVFSAFNQIQKFDLKASIARGKDIYTAQCMSCHQEQGEGIEDIYPPLAKSDYLMADKKRSIQQIIHGASGEIKVNGKTYNGEMPAFELTDAGSSCYARGSCSFKKINYGRACTERRCARKAIPREG